MTILVWAMFLLDRPSDINPPFTKWEKIRGTIMGLIVDVWILAAYLS
jgi:hypothetical protein